MYHYPVRCPVILELAWGDVVFCRL